MAIKFDENSLAYFTVNGQMLPAEGPRAVPLALDFSLTGEYDLNLQNIVSRGYISMIQAVFLDNSANASSLTIAFPGSSQEITIAPNRQGYFAVLCPNPPALIFYLLAACWSKRTS